MSLVVEKVNGKTVDTQFTGYPVRGVQIGEHEISLDHFCAMTVHFLGGGFFGWGGETPEAVNCALSNLFELYEQVDGKWVRKAKYCVDLSRP